MADYIFIVDDDPLMAFFLRESLRQLGYTTRHVRNGEDALEQMRAEPPAMAILDQVMPDMGGWELARLMRQDQRLQSVPILFCTAQQTPQGVELVNGVLHKPFGLDELEHIVRTTLARPPAAK